MDYGPPSEAELSALADQVDNQLNALQSAPPATVHLRGVTAGESAELPAAPNQQAVIEQAAGEAFETFWQKYRRHARRDLCLPGGLLFEQWRKWRDLQSKDSVKVAYGIVAGMGIPTASLAPVAVALLISFALFGQRLEAATINAASPSLADVTAAVASAVDGDTVILPAGTADWTGTLSITKGITLQGATTVSGAGTSGATATDLTILQDDVSRSPGARMINVNITQSQSFRITGITFAPGATTVIDTTEGGAINLQSTGSSANYTIRMDNCHFGQLYQSHYIAINGWNCGVADHNFIELATVGTVGACFIINHATWLNGISGHGSWADYPRFGTRDAFFIETNTIIRTSVRIITDTGAAGGRYVFRKNYVTNGVIQNHGTEGGGARGGRAYEVYDNTLNFTTASSAGETRGGSCIWHDNTFTGIEPYTLSILRNYREGAGRPRPVVWGQADGTGPWDKNVTDVGADQLDKTQQTFVQAHSPYVFDSGTDTSSLNSQGVVHDSTKNWATNQWVGYTVKKISQLSSTPDDGICVGSYITSNTSNTITYFYYGHADVPVHLIFNRGDRYQIHRVLACLDQVGSGKADFLSGDPLSDSNCSPVSRTCGTITITGCWSNQQVEPCYSWNNVCTSNGHVKEFNTPVGQPTTVLGTDYFNLGDGLPADTIPDAVKSSYAASVNGSDYLYEYTYPHPLVSGVEPTPTPSPTPTPTPTATPTPTPTPTVTVTVQTSPTSRNFTVDSTPYSSAQTFSWQSGSSHTIATTSPQSAGIGIQYLWGSWSDGGAVSHAVAPTTNRTYTSTFSTQFYLTMNPGTGGSVSPNSGWRGSGTLVSISAAPASGYSFTNWSGTGTGAYSGTNNSKSITMTSIARNWDATLADVQ